MLFYSSNKAYLGISCIMSNQLIITRSDAHIQLWHRTRFTIIAYLNHIILSRNIIKYTNYLLYVYSSDGANSEVFEFLINILIQSFLVSEHPAGRFGICRRNTIVATRTQLTDNLHQSSIFHSELLNTVSSSLNNNYIQFIYILGTFPSSRLQINKLWKE